MEIYSETDEDEDEIDGESTLFHKIYAYTTEICLQVCISMFCSNIDYCVKIRFVLLLISYIVEFPFTF